MRTAIVRPSTILIGMISAERFFVAEEVSVLRFDKVTRKRPDVVLYINGIALGVFELKSSYVSAGRAYVNFYRIKSGKIS